MKTRFLSFITALSIMLTSALMFPQINVFAEEGESVLLLNDSTINSYSASGEIKFKQVSSGFTHIGIIATNGDLYMCGNNGSGQLGNGNYKSTYKPIKIMEDILSTNVDFNVSSAITTNGDLYMWGTNLYGQLGNGKSAYYTESYPTKLMSNGYCRPQGI